MGQDRWHIVEEDGALTMARRLPARFDLAVEAVIEGGAGLRRGRIARQVLQDVWRALQNLRGFSPAARVVADGADLRITVGGQVAGVFAKANSEAIIADLINDPRRRARWMRHAGKAA
ncbi:hypothetical protein [Celeribacter arenosi]|uniref:Uncharacterized protein n=1 Tax=Celeribacter arenosi TaxID=792649 RepID=A0ABP7JSM1_9RHOB